MNKKMHSFFVSIFVAVSLVLTNNFAVAVEPPKSQLIIPDFRALAKRAIPAVVSIKVEATSKSKEQTRENPNFDDPFESFGGDFWQKFFGFPRRPGNEGGSVIMGQASGVIVSPDGYILTNTHVVNGYDNIIVTLNDGREFKAKVVGKDENSDLAVIKVDADNLPYLRLADSDKIEIGEWVAAIGNPFGLQASLTTGVVSAKGRSGLDIVPHEDFIQTDAAINRGNSGGPLLNLNGDVIGINTAIATSSSSGGYMGVGFAIPSNMANYVMQQILAHGSVTRGFLGVTLQKLNYNLAQAFNLPNLDGALISDVAKDSPAGRAGLQRGDIVISYNNQPVESIVSLRNAIAFMAPGSKVYLTVRRGDETMNIPVEVGTFPEKEVASTQSNKLGIEVENITPEIANKLNLEEEQGVIVSKVAPNSPAAFTGLKRGALIVSVNQQKVASIEKFNKAISETEEGKPVLLLVKQNSSMYYVSIKVD
jgi:serine protease Do